MYSPNDFPSTAGGESEAIGPATPRVLLALGRRDCSRACLLRAFDVARSLEAAVDVVRVLPRRHGWSRWVPKPLARWLDRRQKDQARATLRATRYWLAGAYGIEPPAGHVVIRSGAFVHEVVSHSERRQAVLIIVPPDLGRLGSVVTQLALLARRRIFVARPPCRSRTILAASDLATPGLPVLQEAARLVRVLRMALVSFHQVNPLSSDDQDDGSERGPMQLASSELRLERALEWLATPGAAEVRLGVDPASAIVTEAHDRQADLVVVGVRQRSRLERLVYGSIAAQVVKRAGCSVLVAPVTS
jgi:nucleotide-binding universal stress UspA family protein